MEMARNSKLGAKSKVKKLVFCFIAFLIAAFGFGQTSVPAAMPRIQVSDLNSHYLVTEEGKPLFLNVDSAWAIWRLDREGVAKYFSYRKEQKFNGIMMASFPENWSSEGLGALENAYRDRPFESTDGKWKWNPLAPMTTPGANPSDVNEYDFWDHIDYILEQAENNGFYVLLLPTYGTYVAGSWSGEDTSGIIFNKTNAYGYGRWIGQRYKDKTNIIWTIGGDRSAVYGDKDYRAVFRALAEGVADGVNGQNKQDGKADYNTTFMTYHPRKSLGNSSTWFHNDKWLDFDSIQDWPKDQISAVDNDWKLTPVKPTWLLEGRYENYIREGFIYKVWHIRFQAYTTLFAGGCGNGYGNMGIIFFNTGWEKHLDDPGAVSMKYLYELISSLSREQFLNRTPRQDIIDGSQGAMGDHFSDRIQATCDSRGSFAFVYSANGRDILINMDLLAEPDMEAFWFNPRNGKWHVEGREFAKKRPFEKDISSGRTASVHKFDPPGKPGENNDWVLVLEVQKATIAE
jgi:hypothetical protein